MFEVAEVGSRIDKDAYKAVVPALRVELLNAQYDLRTADFPVIILIAGDDRQASNEVVNLLHEWMDARYIETHFFGRPTQEERERPRFWRYWRVLPPKGRIGMYLGAWALNAIGDRVRGEIDADGLDHRITQVQQFEADLGNDGALLLKFWFHLPKDEYRKRLKRARKDPDKEWDVAEEDWAIYEVYDKAIAAAERVLRKTNSPAAPWHVVESTDDRYRNLTVAETIRDAVTSRLRGTATETDVAVGTSAVGSHGRGALDTVDLAAALAKDRYREELDKYQARLHGLSRRARDKGVSSVLVFEGWDAAGKGGAIRRLTAAMDARDYRLVPIAAPTEEEKARHYLWRFWRHLPRAGKMLIFDRSWYGRVLVERIEGFAKEHEWRRAYAEINDFEEQLVEHGIPVLKFWLHLDPDEQLRRFQAREQTDYKKYKITAEDYRNREQWDAYVTAINDMVAQTSTEIAPWHLVAANDKRWARIQVLKSVCEGLKHALKKR